MIGKLFVEYSRFNTFPMCFQLHVTFQKYKKVEDPLPEGLENHSPVLHAYKPHSSAAGIGGGCR